MSKLSLKSTDPAHDVSIRLIPGQFCTLGSSSAADYCVRAEGISPMHCRIGCRVTGGFIECFDAGTMINIAGTDKNRSRLVDGDRLKIGALNIEVIIPQPNAPAKSFEIEFDDIESTDVAATAPLASDLFVEAKTDPQDGVESPVAGVLMEPSRATFDDFDFASAEEANSNSDSNSIEPVEEETLSADPASSEEAIQKANQPANSEQRDVASSVDDTNLQNTNQSSKPVFEFDSVDADDIKLTEEDLDVIENMTGNSLVLQDFDSMVAETFPEQDRRESNASNSLDGLTSEPNSESDDFIPSGSDTGKCYHWTGKAVLPTVEIIEQRNAELQCYEILGNVGLKQCTFADVKQAIEKKNGPKIFVLTEKNLDEVSEFFGSKRWRERIGHPQALSMFLTLLPAKAIKQLFAEVDACVLVQSSDLELVRLNSNLKKLA